jgi:hypothetical protein
MSRHFFLHASSGESWEVDDPTQWCLENVHDLILERARERLVTLDTRSDPQRVIRLVTRRCQLNLIEFLLARVVVHYWGQDGLADLRPFFKRHGLARRDVAVASCERKHEVITLTSGVEFLYGVELVTGFPVDIYRRKWQRQAVEEPDDGQAAPHSWSSFVWEGVEPGRIPWAVLKSAWRREAPLTCPNCDRPLLIQQFGWQYTFLNRYPRIVHLCPDCCRSFEAHSFCDQDQRLVACLDQQLWPGFQRVRGRLVKWRPSRDRV